MDSSWFVGKKFLIAEDNPDILLLTTTLLKRRGVVVTAASDGSEALALARTDRFDVVLLDYHMPVKDGLEVARELRASGYPGALVVLTASSFRDQLPKLSGVLVMAKPLSLEMLLRHIRSRP